MASRDCPAAKSAGAALSARGRAGRGASGPSEGRVGRGKRPRENSGKAPNKGPPGSGAPARPESERERRARAPRPALSQRCHMSRRAMDADAVEALPQRARRRSSAPSVCACARARSRARTRTRGADFESAARSRPAASVERTAGAREESTFRE